MRAAARSLPPAVWLLAAAAAALRLWHGLTDLGIHWPDEVFQSLEPAHHLVFGPALLPWEYVEGARTWALPGLFAAVLELGRLAGLDGPREYLPLVRAVMALIGAATAVATYALARAAGAERAPALAGAAAFAFAAPVVFFGHRALGEVVSALPVTAGLALALRGRPAAGASLLGLAVVLRLHNGVFAAGLLLVLVARREWRPAGRAAAALAAWAVLLGLLDRLTWGGWWQSAREYLAFNLVEDGAARVFGTEPATFYAETLWHAAPAVTLLLAIGALAAAPRAPGLLAIVALDLALLSATGHKELRFVLPAVPALCALAAVGLRGRVAPAALAVAAVVSGATAGGLTQRDVGQPFEPQASAWGRFEDVNRRLLDASERPDLCGLRLEPVDAAFSGGLTYLHRDARLYGPAEGRPGTYNYVIEGAPARLRKVADACAPDPAYDGRLNDRPG